jgi:hypothetical protein
VTLGAIGLRLRGSDAPPTVAHAMGVPAEFLNGELGR